jgi:hypothetical protein
MALLAAPTTEPGVTLRFISTVGPVIEFAQRFQRPVAAIACAALGPTYWAATALVSLASIVLLWALTVTRFVAMKTASASQHLPWALWNSKPIRRLRRKLEFEFFVLVLGFGNAACLYLFYPGFWLCLAVIYVLWAFIV